MSETVKSRVGCEAFRDELPPMTPGVIHRYVVGEDEELRAYGPGQAEIELGDPFATLLLLRGVFPTTAGDVLQELGQAAPAGELLADRMFFFVGENSQIPFAEGAQRSLRFLATTGQTPEGPDVLISSFNPEETDVELMAWDRRSGGFNYYRTVGESSGWVFAGNSRHALEEVTEFNGPFSSHAGGNFLMKELRAPWMNWDSPDAPVSPDVFGPDDPRGAHEWFRRKEKLGAFTCETKVARPAIVRWTRKRFEPLRSGSAAVERPVRIMQQVLQTPAVNLVTSHTQSRAVSGDVDLPQTFFVDSETLTETAQLGLDAPPPLAVPGAVYQQALETFDVHWTDGGQFTRRGDTHFAFCVPERAFEDVAVVREAIDVGLLTPRFAASLLMTDFANPTVSARRAALIAHVPATAAVERGESGFSEEMADAIVAAADSTPEGSPEREFAERWAAGDAWKETFNALLDDYYAALQQKLSDQDGFDAVFRLAEARRDHVRGSDRFPKMPIAEFPLLFAQTNVPSGDRQMRPDGSVVEV
jgi:hypothetical protein